MRLDCSWADVSIDTTGITMMMDDSASLADMDLASFDGFIDCAKGIEDIDVGNDDDAFGGTLDFGTEGADEMVEDENSFVVVDMMSPKEKPTQEHQEQNGDFDDTATTTTTTHHHGHPLVGPHCMALALRIDALYQQQRVADFALKFALDNFRTFQRDYAVAGDTGEQVAYHMMAHRELAIAGGTQQQQQQQQHHHGDDDTSVVVAV